jgi:hypothetical protein
MAMNPTILAQAIADNYELILPAGATSPDVDKIVALAQAIIEHIEDYYDPGTGVTSHPALSNLDYASAGHTGFQPALGYTPEDVSNKDTDNTMSSDSDTKYPSQKAVKHYIDNYDHDDLENISGGVAGQYNHIQTLS